jgi:arylsulfatase A
VKRRTFLKQISYALTTASLFKCSWQPPNKPNFIFILADDLGWGDLGCYGHPYIKTPHLDKLASKGIKLTDCHSAGPLCSPSRAAILTGKTPYRIGFRDITHRNNPPKVFGIPHDEITVTQLFKKAGYATSIVGKWHVGGNPDEYGFDYWMVTTGGGASPNHLEVENFIRNGKPVGKTSGPSAMICADECIAWIDGLNGDRPFFLMFASHEPHEPIATADEYWKVYQNKGLSLKEELYYGNVSQLDAACGKLFDYLEQKGIANDTLIIFTSDNGPEYRAETSAGSAGPYRGKKLSVYEGGIRVPGIIYWPGKLNSGSTNETTINGTDFMPTMCSVADINMPNDLNIDGINLLPYLMDSNKHKSPNRPLYWRYWRERQDGRIAVRLGDWKLVTTNGEAPYAPFELYNLANDKREQHNLADTHQAELDTLLDVFQQLHADVSKNYCIALKKQKKLEGISELRGSEGLKEVSRPQINLIKKGNTKR